MISEAVDRFPVRVRRRRWSAEVKAQIVAESFAAGAVVSTVARRHGISPRHLSVWRKAARIGLLKLPIDAVVTISSGMSARQGLSSGGETVIGLLGGPLPGQEFIQPGGGPEVDQPGENVAQIGLGFDAPNSAAAPRSSIRSNCSWRSRTSSKQLPARRVRAPVRASAPIRRTR
jgi:hypothetical protein